MSLAQRAYRRRQRLLLGCGFGVRDWGVWMRPWLSLTLFAALSLTACAAAPVAQGASVLSASATAPSPHEPVAEPPQSPTAEPAPSPSNPSRALKSAYILGDSLTYKARKFMADALAEQGWSSNPATDSRIGRMVGEGLQVLAKESGLPQTVLIALGTNNWLASSREAAEWIREARSIVGPDRDLIWVNIDMVGERFSNFSNVNAGLWTGAEADNRSQRKANAAGRTYIADWYGYASDNRIRHSRDGVHYKSGASKKRMDFYAGILAADTEFLPYIKP